jgi:hypothetical protein
MGLRLPFQFLIGNLQARFRLVEKLRHFEKSSIKRFHHPVLAV